MSVSVLFKRVTFQVFQCCRFSCGSKAIAPLFPSLKSLKCVSLTPSFTNIPPITYYSSKAKSVKTSSKMHSESDSENPPFDAENILNMSGDFNEIRLLGTIYSLKVMDKKMSDSSVLRWASIKLRTIQRWRSDQKSQYKLLFHTVHVFDPQLIELIMLLNAGDRIFIVGGIAYHKDSRNNFTNSIIAQRMIPMIVGEDESATSLDGDGYLLDDDDNAEHDDQSDLDESVPDFISTK